MWYLDNLECGDHDYTGVVETLPQIKQHIGDGLIEIMLQVRSAVQTVGGLPSQITVHNTNGESYTLIDLYTVQEKKDGEVPPYEDVVAIQATATEVISYVWAPCSPAPHHAYFTDALSSALCSSRIPPDDTLVK